MKALSKEWAESKLPNEDDQEIGAGCPASNLFGLMKFSKAQLKKIHALMRKYQISKNEAAKMYVQSGI